MRLAPAGCASLLAVFLCAPGARAQSADDLGKGIQQVKAKDFAGAIVTLDPVARGLVPALDPGEISQAHLYLGMAFVGLAQDAQAREHFRAALELDPGLRLAKGRYPARVFELFEVARKEVQKAQGQSGPHSWRPFAIAGAGVAAGIIAVGRPQDGQDVGRPDFFGAHFATASVVCPDGSTDQLLAVPVLVQANNPTAVSVLVSGVSTTVITETSTVVEERGFRSTRPSLVQPTFLNVGEQATLQVDTTLACSNAVGDAPRTTEVSARLTVSTSAGTFVVATPDRLRIDFP